MKVFTGKVFVVLPQLFLTVIVPSLTRDGTRHKWETDGLLVEFW